MGLRDLKYGPNVLAKLLHYTLISFFIATAPDAVTNDTLTRWAQMQPTRLSNFSDMIGQSLQM